MTLEYLLKLSTGAFTSPLKQATAGVGGLNQSLGGMSRHNGAVNNLGSSFTSLAGKIAAAFTAWKAGEAVFSGFKKSIGLAADAETTATAFKTLVGSAELANSVLAKVKKMADTTPFEFPELAGAARMLVAFGEDAKNVPDTLKRIGDVASGVAAPVGQISTIYGQVRQAGRLMGQDLLQFTSAGIPVIGELAKMLGKSESAIRDLVEEGKIGFPLVDQAFRNMTSEGGKFYNMMADQARTTNGMFSNLRDGVDGLFKAFGTPLNDAIKPLLQDAMGLIEQLKPTVVQLGAHTAEAVTAVRNFVAEAGAAGGLAEAMGAKLKAAFLEAADVAAIPFRAIGAALPSIGSSFMAVLAPAGQWLLAKLESAALNFSSLIMKGIRDALTALSESDGILGMIPGLKEAANNVNGPAAMAQNDAKLSDNKADRIAENMPKALAAAAKAAEAAMKAFKDKTGTELQRVGLGVTNKDGKGMSYGQVPKFESKGMVTGGDEGAAGLQGAKDAVNAPKGGDAAGKKAEKQKEFLSLEQKEMMLLKAKADGNTALVEAMERKLKIDKEVNSLKDKGNVSDEEALKMARTKVALEEQVHKMANVTKMVPDAVKKARQKPAGEGEDGPRKIHGYSAAQGGRMMGGGLRQHALNQQRDGKGVTAFGTGGLSSRKPTMKLPSPGTAKAEQGRREAAASEARGGGADEPKWDLVAMIAQHIQKLAPA